ncbi:hypothetical protein U1872_00080 [Sphingomonas sp. RB3P16]|uniref:hypothetical protein n=1 Tax=Parasphingomonas frigoris TaxID=3096163 RepID=UPI002FC66138
MSSHRTRVTFLTGAALAALGATPAFAQTAPPAGTTSGTVITNQATVSYSIGGSPASVTSNAATFLVDKKVDLTVAAVNTPTYVAIGSNDQVTTFTVTNNTNAIQDFRLEASTTALTIPLLGTGDFTPTTVRVFVDSNDNHVYDAADTQTFINELAPDATINVFIVANIPNTAGIRNGIVALNAVVAAGGSAGLGADLVATSTLAADNPNAVDIVFADAAGPLLTLDGARDGHKVAFNQYVIDNAAIALAKTSRVISDPINLLLNPKAIPGATVEYCLTASNAGPGTASGVTLADAIPANTTYVANSIVFGTAGPLGTCILLQTGTGTFDGTTVRATLGTLTPLVPLAASFRVTIN